METQNSNQPNNTLIIWKGEVIDKTEKAVRVTIPVKCKGKRRLVTLLTWLPLSVVAIDGNQISLPLWKALDSVYYLMPQGAEIINYTKEEQEAEKSEAEA